MEVMVQRQYTKIFVYSDTMSAGRVLSLNLPEKLSMISRETKVHYIGTATALLEIGGLRLLTDPAFDPAGTIYTTPVYTLHKLQPPSITVEQLGPIDYVLLSHDHHLDNLDRTGMKMLTKAGEVITTPAGAERLNTQGSRLGDDPAPKGIHAVGLPNWATVEIPTKDGRILTITGTPCRHGPAGGDRGPVTGFVINFKGETKNGIYITGDTVWYEGVEEVGKRFDIGLLLLFIGAARLAAVGPAPLTMTVEDSLLAARLFDHADIVPLHFEGWEHFSQGRDEIIREYTAAGMADRLHWAPVLTPP
jgi:L-ascorbate metabolism protein UlaG (beta-lactamase superfamily)